MSALRDLYFFFSSRRRHTRLQGDWSSDVCSSDLSRHRKRGSYRRRPGNGLNLKACSGGAAHELKAGVGQQRRACITYQSDDFTRLDRKSTRLNSSHLVISYAVFCLKKKKHRPNRLPHDERHERVPSRLLAEELGHHLLAARDRCIYDGRLRPPRRVDAAHCRVATTM